jgi:hypothetical protein
MITTNSAEVDDDCLAADVLTSRVYSTILNLLCALGLFKILLDFVT